MRTTYRREYIKFLLEDATTKQFYSSRAWRNLRMKVFHKYPRVCMCCGDSESQMQIDHIQPRSRVPHMALTFSNLQVLCGDCNGQKSAVHAEDYRELAATRELDRTTYMAALAVGL